MAATTDCKGIDTDSDDGFTNDYEGGKAYRQVDRPQAGGMMGIG